MDMKEQMLACSLHANRKMKEVLLEGAGKGLSPMILVSGALGLMIYDMYTEMKKDTFLKLMQSSSKLFEMLMDGKASIKISIVERET